jgi:hypothetical protein
MFKKRVLGVLMVLAVLLLVAAQCQQVGVPVTVVETVVVEKEVEKVVTQEVMVEVTPERPEGDTLLIGGFGPLSAPGSYQGARKCGRPPRWPWMKLTKPAACWASRWS